MSSDTEMKSPPSSKRSTRTAQNGSKKHERESSEEAADDQAEEEEYEIEKLLDAKKGHFAPKRWAFEVKWKGYPDSENSWVDEPDIFAKELIEQFWEDHPDFPGNPRKVKKGRKSVTSSKVSSTAGRPRKSNVSNAAASDDEESTKPVKRKSKKEKAASEELVADVVSGSEDEVVVQEVRPKKKAKSTSVSRAAKEKENGFFDNDEPDKDVSGHDLTTMDKYKNKKSWEDIIVTIDTVEKTEEGVLMVYFTTKSGERAICDSKALGLRAPQKLLEFYEFHLRWRGVAQPVPDDDDDDD